MEEKVLEMYPATWFIQYELLKKEQVPFSGPDESFSNLSHLYTNDRKFFRDLVSDEALRQRYKGGGKNESEHESENFKTIEAALKNRGTFARLQLSRILSCEIHILDEDEKKRVAHDSYQELMQSMNLLEDWGTKTALELHDDLLENFEEARALCKRVGVDLEEDEENVTSTSEHEHLCPAASADEDDNMGSQFTTVTASPFKSPVKK